MKTKTKIKSLILFAISMLISGVQMQGQAFDSIDKNPQDIAYYRPGLKSKPQVKVVYGRPQAQDDIVFGTQVPFGEVWETGSNESTEVQFFCDVMFGNKFVRAGKYVLYTIPNKYYWTIILNEKTDTYGVHFYDPEYNVAKIEVPVQKGSKLEVFSIGFNMKDYGTQMTLGFARTRVKIPLYTEESLISKI
jgi:hypothetical protein